MIARMSKVELIGPKDLLLATLALLQQLEVFHVETDPASLAVKAGDRSELKSFLLDREALSERLYHEELQRNIAALLAMLPKVATREIFLDPAMAIPSIAAVLPGHIQDIEARTRQGRELSGRRDEMMRYSVFLTALGDLLPAEQGDSSLEYIGVEFRDDDSGAQLHRSINAVAHGRFELQTTQTSEGVGVGLVIIEKELARQLRDTLDREKVPEFHLPDFLSALPFAERLVAVRKRLADLDRQIADLDGQLVRFSHHWLSIYLRVHDWLGQRLHLLQAATALYETEMCFVILGWIPSEAVSELQAEVTRQFSGQVVVEEKEIFEDDLERIPVSLRNPLYFKPFEMFIRLLPLPRYSSVDPTPFLGIFFPIFFGMILADIGYGLILLAAGMPIALFVRKSRNLQDFGRIIVICALYTLIFGWLFGEFFGGFGHRFLHMEPVWMDRRTAIFPMLSFALSVGIIHVCMGLFMGFLSALKGGERLKALFKLGTILFVLCGVVLLGGYFFADAVPQLARRPAFIGLLVLALVILVSGGVLAPLELFKTLGNIISYARIMAVGLTSVLLAHVANQLAGMAGGVLLGGLIALLLHAFNIVLGVFAPTIHSLRLHYVEFFSKFIEPGGRIYRPLEKKK